MLLMTRWKWVETMRLWHRHRNNGIRLHWELLLIGDTAKTCDTARCWPNNRQSSTCLSGSRLNVSLRLLRQHSKLYTAHFVLITVFFGTHFSDRERPPPTIDRNGDGRCRGLSSAARGVFSSPEVPSPSGVAHSRRNLSSRPPVVASFCREEDDAIFSDSDLPSIWSATRILRKSAHFVARDDVEPPSNTGYKSIITPLIGMLRFIGPPPSGATRPQVTGL